MNAKGPWAAVLLAWGLAACPPSPGPCEDPGGACGEADAGGADAGVVCVPECQDFEACLAGGVCEPRYEGIDLTWPPPNSFFFGGLTLTARLRTRPDFSANDPAQLPFTVTFPDGTLLAEKLERNPQGAFRFDFEPNGEGKYTFEVTYPDARLSSGPLAFAVDKTRPVFEVRIPAPQRRGLWERDPAAGFGEAWRRDEVVRVEVVSDEPNMNASSVLLWAVGVDGGASGRVEEPLLVSSAPGCGRSYCGAVEVDVAKVEFRAFRGEVEVRVRGEDRAGNWGEADAGVRVTRWKWQLGLGGFQATSPAVGAKGTVYVGTQGPPGGVVAIDPDGTLRWRVDGGAVSSALAVGRTLQGSERVFWAESDTSSSWLRAANSPSGLESDRCAFPPGELFGGVTLMESQRPGEVVPREMAVAVVNSDGGLLVALRADAGECPSREGVGEVWAEAGLVANGKDLFLGDTALSGWRYLESSGGFVPNIGWPVGLPPAERLRSLVVSGSELLGTAGGGATVARALGLLLGGGQLTWSFVDGVALGEVSGAAVAAGPELVFATDEPLVFRVAPGASSAKSRATGLGQVRGTPVLGEGGHVYLATLGGELASFTSNLALEWSASIGPTNGSPALDCARLPSGAAATGQPGVLYLGVGGAMPGLVAVVTDSRGLDTSAPWPKFHRDPRNTGNGATDLSAFSCP